MRRKYIYIHIYIYIYIYIDTYIRATKAWDSRPRSHNSRNFYLFLRALMPWKCELRKFCVAGRCIPSGNRWFNSGCDIANEWKAYPRLGKVYWNVSLSNSYYLMWRMIRISIFLYWRGAASIPLYRYVLYFVNTGFIKIYWVTFSWYLIQHIW